MESHEDGPESSVEIELRGLSIYTHHGVSDAEQEIGQRLEFDISFDVPDCDAVLTDRLEDTVDYAEACDIVALAATERSYRTLERLCRVVGERLLERFGCESVTVRASKPEPPLPLAIDEVAVEVTHERARDEDEHDGHDGHGEDEVLSGGYLGLGSNVGDRPGHLRAAIEALPRHGVEVKAVSSAYETEPVGEVTDQPEFLNACVRIATGLEPEALLDVCKAIEIERGRTLGPRHGPRPLDIDLLLFGATELAAERLTLPHREVRNRRFVLEPLLELDPDLKLPDGTVLADCLAALPEGEQGVRRAGPLTRP